jgi:hypothetical protein
MVVQVVKRQVKRKHGHREAVGCGDVGHGHLSGSQIGHGHRVETFHLDTGASAALSEADEVWTCGIVVVEEELRREYPAGATKELSETKARRATGVDREYQVVAVGELVLQRGGERVAKRARVQQAGLILEVSESRSTRRLSSWRRLAMVTKVWSCRAEA